MHFTVQPRQAAGKETVRRLLRHSTNLPRLYEILTGSLIGREQLDQLLWESMFLFAQLALSAQRARRAEPAGAIINVSSATEDFLRGTVGKLALTEAREAAEKHLQGLDPRSLPYASGATAVLAANRTRSPAFVAPHSMNWCGSAMVLAFGEDAAQMARSMPSEYPGRERFLSDLARTRLGEHSIRYTLLQLLQERLAEAVS